MLKNLRYTPSFGETTICNIDLLRKIIFEYDTNYWLKNNDAMLDFCETDINSYSGDTSLILFYDEPYGFFIYYDGQFVSVKKNISLTDNTTIKHLVGGEPIYVPSICYRTQEETWEIIMDFVNYQKKTEKYNWITLSDIDYKNGTYLQLLGSAE